MIVKSAASPASFSDAPASAALRIAGSPPPMTEGKAAAASPRMPVIPYSTKSRSPFDNSRAGLFSANDSSSFSTTPRTASDAAFADLLARCARELPPDARGGGCFAPSRIRERGDMGASDDATILMRAVQAQGGLAAYAFLGADLAAGHHQPDFDFDEAVLWPGVRWLEKVCRELAG